MPNFAHYFSLYHIRKKISKLREPDTAFPFWEKVSPKVTEVDKKGARHVINTVPGISLLQHEPLYAPQQKHYSLPCIFSIRHSLAIKASYHIYEEGNGKDD